MVGGVDGGLLQKTWPPGSSYLPPGSSLRLHRAYAQGFSMLTARRALWNFADLRFRTAVTKADQSGSKLSEKKNGRSHALKKRSVQSTWYNIYIYILFSRHISVSCTYSNSAHIFRLWHEYSSSERVESSPSTLETLHTPPIHGTTLTLTVPSTARNTALQLTAVEICPAVFFIAHKKRSELVDDCKMASRRTDRSDTSSIYIIEFLACRC